MVGRPKFQPTAEERANVAAMQAYGIEREIMRQLIRRPVGTTGTLKPISLPTLRRYFKEELESGLGVMLSKVADSLFRRAMNLEHPSGAASAMFILKCRGGWRERIEHTGKDGKPIEMSIDLAGASDEALAVLERFFSRKALAEPANDSKAA